LKSGTQAGAEWRVLVCAALIGSGVGLGVGAAYMASGMARAVVDHGRAERIAEAADGGFSESVLQRNVAAMDSGAVRVARGHDPFASDLQRDRQAELLAAGLERRPVDRAKLQGRTPPQPARELDCLTQAVYFEARGETPRGQAAVAQVVLNRVRHPAFPKTVCGVVFQGAARHGCQFSFACDGSMRIGREAAAWKRARKVAARALSGAVLSDVGTATHFHTTGVAPAWGPRMLRVAQVGLHVFYRFNPRPPALRPDASERVVFASLPVQPGSPADGIRLAAAITEKAADGVVAASGLTPAPVVAQPQQPVAVQAPAPVEAKPAAKAAEPQATLTRTSDTAPKAPKPADAAAS
jgi:hypothetical protein